MTWRILLLLMFALGSLQTTVLAEPAQSTLIVGRFTEATVNPPAPWQLVQFDRDIPKTVYRIVRWDGIVAVEATADGGMALLARPLDVDLEKTPVLCWRWRVDAPLRSADMARKDGDDYAARVYVAFDFPDGTLSWKTQIQLGLARKIYGDQVPDAAINYVWDNRYPVSTYMLSAYTERTGMWVLQSGTAQLGQWVIERRNVLSDVRRAFGQSDVNATSLAIASDTDNTGEYARAGFADLHFVSAHAQCDFSFSNE
jgi:hypothetical protein